MYDAVIVGARCAGATLALSLARAGADVLLVDKDTFPSDTLSTHLLYPNTLQRLVELGVWERLTSKHEIPLLESRFTILGNELSGGWTPIGGFDRATSITRPTLDATIIDAAAEAGATVRLGEPVTGLIGAGTSDDPVRGIRLEGGDEALGRWIFGADGRVSFVARSLGLAKRNEMAGELSLIWSYWRGLPPTEVQHLEVSHRLALAWFPCEDGIDLVGLNGTPDLTHGTAATRERVFAEGIRSFPDTINGDAFDRAERVSDLRIAPETMLRGFFKQATGPGWALVGDAGHFKHPSTAQGISDAVEQAIWIGEALNGDDPHLDGYESWRDARAVGHYELSFTFATWPVLGRDDKLFAGLASEPDAQQDFRDTLSRKHKPDAVFTPERLARWFA